MWTRFLLWLLVLIVDFFLSFFFLIVACAKKKGAKNTLPVQKRAKGRCVRARAISKKASAIHAVCFFFGDFFFFFWYWPHSKLKHIPVRACKTDRAENKGKVRKRVFFSFSVSLHFSHPLCLSFFFFQVSLLLPILSTLFQLRPKQDDTY